jgi:hypothetical protein
LPRPEEVAGESLTVKGEAPEPVQLAFILVPPEAEEANSVAVKPDVGYSGVRLILKFFDDEVRSL